jgi:predicted acyltransferase
MTLTSQEPAITRPTATGSQGRLLSIDALRGLTICFMIMVNNNASDKAWPFMEHADWNGMTPTDLVFPTFLFLVGAAIVFAFEARLAKGATRAQLVRQTFRRALTLYLLGFLIGTTGKILYHHPHFAPEFWRYYGVLPRIAICYLIASLLYLWDRRWQSKAILIAVALIGYYLLMRYVRVPGFGMPGTDIPFLDNDANLAAWLDRRLFTASHLYEQTRDPEGLLSTLPAIGTVLLGQLAGMWLRSKHTLQRKAAGLAAGATTLIALGSLWAIWFPLNKKLWTSSYALVAAGIATALLALFFWAIEIKGWRGKWAWPLLVLGSNSIAAYVISDLLGMLTDLIPLSYNGLPIGPLGLLYMSTYAHISNSGLASFCYSFTYMAICFLPVWFMYRKKIFLKV